MDVEVVLSDEEKNRNSQFSQHRWVQKSVEEHNRHIVEDYTGNGGNIKRRRLESPSTATSVVNLIDHTNVPKSPELIFNGPLQDILSRLADVFVLLRERLMTFHNFETENAPSLGATCGLVFGPVEVD